jgi:ribose-phosphate pyrophosphokinase
MNPLVFSLFGKTDLSQSIQRELNLVDGNITLRKFPDEEVYLKINTELKDRSVIVIDSLNHTDQKILPLLFFVKTAKELGAKKIGLVAPYLAYMRQDKRFHPGEAITSNYFSELISQYFDWLITVDPHLHRYHDLNEIYSIPTTVIHAAPEISQWIELHIKKPVLIGPDAESEQWVSEVAKKASAPYFILEKIRRGDRDVKVSLPELDAYRHHTPVLVDDIISTAGTMLETIKHLKEAQMRAPVCISIHAVFSNNTYSSLLQKGVEQVVTCNTISHPSNKIDLSAIMVDVIKKYITEGELS